MPLDAGSFDNGDVSGTAVQTYLPGAMPNFDNTLIVKNAGTSIMQGRVTRVVTETVNKGQKPVPGFPGLFMLDLESTGYAEYTLDSAFGDDTTIFDALLELSDGTIEGVINLGVYGNAGTGGDPALFTSTGLAPVFTADFDIDGNVDGSDFLVWQRNFDSGSSQITGDANEDGFNDSVDLAIWQLQYGAGAASPLIAIIQVPEPSSLLLVASVACGVVFRRNRVPRCGTATDY